MTTLNRPRGHTTPRRTALLASDGVIASYLHDISQRHRNYATSSRTRGATSSPRRTKPTGSLLGTRRPMASVSSAKPR